MSSNLDLAGGQLGIDVPSGASDLAVEAHHPFGTQRLVQ